MKKILFVIILTFSTTHAQKIINVSEKIVEIDSDSISAKTGDVVKILRQVSDDTSDTYVVIGYAKISKIKNGIITAAITEEKENYHIQVGDSLGGKKLDTMVYASVGLLNGGALKARMYNDMQNNNYVNLPYELHYPDNTEIINLGAAGPIVQNRSLYLYFNFGIPLRKIRMSINTPEKFTQNTNIVSVFTDIGIMTYPLKGWYKHSKFQPFIQGGIGLYVIADGWDTLLLALLSASEDTYDPGTSALLAEHMDFDIQFSYGGGVDYFLSKGFGLRLFIKKHMFNLPNMSGAISPFEIKLGIFGIMD